MTTILYMKQIIMILILGAVTVLTGAAIKIRETEDNSYMYNTIMVVGMLIEVYAFYLLATAKRKA